eukprot:1100763-Prymnesium_polylepis.1
MEGGERARGPIGRGDRPRLGRAAHAAREARPGPSRHGSGRVAQTVMIKKTMRREGAKGDPDK